MILVSLMVYKSTVQKSSRKRGIKQVSLKTTLEYLKRRSRDDVLRSDVPEARSSNQIGPITESGAASPTSDQLNWRVQQCTVY